MDKMNDESVLNFGIHKGKKLKDVPDEYLLFLWENRKFGYELGQYLQENIESIKTNVKRNEQTKKC